MDATSYIGRVGALAVALGIGAAMSTGAPSARAEGPDSTAGSSNNGADASVGAPGATSGPARTGPLSAVGARIRKETDTRLEGVSDAVEHVRSEADKVRTRLHDRRAELRATLNDVARPAATPPGPLASLRRAADKTERRQIVPDAVNAVPDLRRPKRASVVVEKVLGKVVDVTDQAQRTAVALPPPSTLRIDTAPVTTALSKTIEAPRMAEDAVVSTLRIDTAPVTTALSKTIEAPRMVEDAVVSTLLATVGLSPFADSSRARRPSPSARRDGMGAT
jgi:hypothetical protein